MKKISAYTAIFIFIFFFFFTGCVDLFYENKDTGINKVTFNRQTATVSFKNLDDNDIYLVKVNTSSRVISPSDTGRVNSLAAGSLNSVDVLPEQFDNLPPMGRPDADEWDINSLPVANQALAMSLTTFNPPVVGDTRNFKVEGATQTAVLTATGDHSNVWVIANCIEPPNAQALAEKFDLIYPIETSLLGYEYGGGPGGDGGKDGDPKIQILVYNIVNASGYFSSVDYGDSANSNRAEMFYLDANTTKGYPNYIYSTLIHEFQHMIHYNVKTIKHRLSSPTWYNEMLSMMAEDIIAPLIGVPPTNWYHVTNQRMPRFLSTYNQVGVTDWTSQSSDSYAKGYAFGAYLLRNYGGADLLRRILANNTTGIESISAALNEISPGTDFYEALRRYGEAMIYSGSSMPLGVTTFDKTVTSTVNGTTYTAQNFDIWTGFDVKGPTVFTVNQMEMRPHSVTVHSDNYWKKRSGSYSITLEKPSDSNVEFYLMVK